MDESLKRKAVRRGPHVDILSSGVRRLREIKYRLVLELYLREGTF